MRGFEKMFALLVGADDELQSEILKTLRTFLDLERTLQPAPLIPSSSPAGSALTGIVLTLTSFLLARIVFTFSIRITRICYILVVPIQLVL